MMLLFVFLLGVAVSLGGLAWVFLPELPGLLPFWLGDISLIVIAGGVVLLAAAWLAGWQTRRDWVSAGALGLTTAVAALGAYLELPTLPLLVSAIGALAAWDLSSFNSRLALAHKEDNTAVLVRHHLFWLGVFVLLSGLLGYGALNWRLRLTFEWLALLVLLGIWGVAQLIRWLRRGGAE